MAKSELPKFPSTIHLTKEVHGAKDDDFLAWATVEEGIVDDGPTFVAEYKLLRVTKFRKQTLACG